MKKVLFIFALGLFVVGCKHPLDIIGQGDILSASNTRNCFYEDALVDHPSCADNEVLPPDDYIETYTAVPRSGWQFHRWHWWCKDNPTNECSWNIPASVVANAGLATLKAQVAIFREVEISGYKSLFMGHSLFDPFAVGMESQAGESGFSNHSQASLFFPGLEGSPINIWNDPIRQGSVQSILDEGDVALFGMAIQHDITDIEGYRLWIDYAYTQNPDVRILIGTPQLWYPNTYTDAAAYETAWQDYLTDTIHPLIDQLRIEFPYVDIYSVPYGQAAVELFKLYEDGNLPDVDELISSTVDSVFLDSRTHPNSILIALGELVWLNAIYGVDMNTYAFDPGYTTDLKAIAAEIAEDYDPNYKAPYLAP